MTRIVVRNTVDMRLLSMQMWKLRTCERAMQEGNKKDKAVLNLNDLARLFGFLRTDEDGEPIEVVPDYDDDTQSQSQDNEEGIDRETSFFGADIHASPSGFSGDEAENEEGGYMDNLNANTE